jgi:Ecdysteroid kinase-like family
MRHRSVLANVSKRNRFFSKNELSFFLRLVYQALEPRPVLIFEDLTKLGYTVPKDPYSFEPAKIIYSKLAAIHATSFYLHHVNGYDFSEFSNAIFDFPPESTETMFGKHLDYFINEIATWPDYAVHQEKFRLFRRRYLEYAKKTTQCIPGGYNVLNHGDFHQKNTLIKLAEPNGTHDHILVSV